MAAAEPPRYPYSGPEPLRAPIDAALRAVVDPEIALSIVDVGLVYGVSATPGRVDVTLTTTSAACPVAATLADDVVEALTAALPPGAAVEVALAWTPAWSPARLSARAREALGWADDAGDPAGASA
jgi:metal-sulfur cluster biosynthetic enzyme